MYVQSTTPRIARAPRPVRTVTSTTGYVLSATVDPQTDLNDLPIAICVYLRHNGQRVAADTLAAVVYAMRDSSAVVVSYADAKGEVNARVLWPNAVSLTKDNAITARCYCTLRKEWKTFRLDRFLTCHDLTTPDDCDAA